MGWLAELIPPPYNVFINRATLTLLLAVSCFGLGFIKGCTAGESRAENDAAVALKEANDHLLAVQRKTAQHETEYLTHIEVISDATRKNVAAAVALPRHCELSPDWVRAHDRSAVGAVPGAPGGDDAGAAGVADNLALGTVSENYGRCLANAQQLAALQRWLRDNRGD